MPEQITFALSDRIDIAHPLLYSLMTYGDGSSTRVPVVNWNTWGLGARGLLTWLVMEALDIKKFPWHPDVVQAEVPIGREGDGVLAILHEHFDTSQKIQSAIDEMRRVYDHTQAVFQRRGQRTITLRRSLYDGDQGSGKEGYASRVLSMAEAARILGQRYFELPSNVLTSWSAEASYGGYPVTIEMEHPIEDVVWSSDLIASKTRHPMTSAIEAGEWILVNRSPVGRLRVPEGAVSSLDVPAKWSPMHKHPKWRSPNIDPRSQEDLARAYLGEQAKMLAPLDGYSLPHHHAGLRRLRWPDRFRLALNVLRPQ